VNADTYLAALDARLRELEGLVASLSMIHRCIIQGEKYGIMT